MASGCIGPTTDRSANLPRTHTHTHTSSLKSVYWTKSKVKHEYRGWQANYQMYSSFCIPTSEGKQMWESCRFHSSRYNDMAQQQKAQPSQGIEMDRVVNLVLSYGFIWWVFTFQASDVCCSVGMFVKSWNASDFFPPWSFYWELHSLLLMLHDHRLWYAAISVETSCRNLKMWLW